MFNEDDIRSICYSFNIECSYIGNLIDTSKGDHDRRFNYQINDDYFLKIGNAKGKGNTFYRDIEKLINHYKSIGVYCPSLHKTREGELYQKIDKKGQVYICHIEDKSKFPVSEPQDQTDYNFKVRVLEHVGQLASKFSNEDLSETKSMWTLIELHTDDIDIDEKQVNFNDLIECLESNGHIELACQLVKQNDQSRKRIKSAMNRLPRCVYQGDLNNSNLLVDENGTFKGVIDFNLFGTEVNINCFLNESMYFLKRQDFEQLSASEIHCKMVRIQNKLLSSITSHYKLNDDELAIMCDYNKVIYTSFWPNVCLMTRILQEKKYDDKVVDLLNMICELKS